MNSTKNTTIRMQGIMLAEAVLKKSQLKELESRKWIEEIINDDTDDFIDILPWIMDDDFQYQKKQLEERIYKYMEFGT